jgi:uncharacterized phage protein gp47/JayE
MPNTIDANGLQTATAEEQTAALQADMQAIYGADINVASNSPDGQLIGIFVQAMQDILDLLHDIYNMFDVDSAYGASLQKLLKINGIAPKTGTYTTTPVDVTVNQAKTLPGLDQGDVPPFQLKDANNTWTLLSSFVFAGAGTETLVFRCDAMGPVQPLPNTITTQATPLSGVTDVNNPTVAGTVLGQNEETDVELKIRHGKSFQLAAEGPADAVEGALLDLDTVTDALVVENKTGGVVGGVPAHSLWCIVVGGVAAEIAQAIYGKAAPGCGLFGGLSANATRPNGGVVAIPYDLGVDQRLYVRFTVTPVTPGLVFDFTLMAQQLAAAAVGYWKLSRNATSGDIVRLMYQIEPKAILTAVEVSNNGSDWIESLAPTSAKYYFTLVAGDVTIT